MRREKLTRYVMSCPVLYTVMRHGVFPGNTEIMLRRVQLATTMRRLAEHVRDEFRELRNGTLYWASVTSIRIRRMLNTHAKRENLHS